MQNQGGQLVEADNCGDEIGQLKSQSWLTGQLARLDALVEGGDWVVDTRGAEAVIGGAAMASLGYSGAKHQGEERASNRARVHCDDFGSEAWGDVVVKWRLRWLCSLHRLTPDKREKRPVRIWAVAFRSVTPFRPSTGCHH